MGQNKGQGLKKGKKKALKPRLKQGYIRQQNERIQRAYGRNETNFG